MSRNRIGSYKRFVAVYAGGAREEVMAHNEGHAAERLWRYGRVAVRFEPTPEDRKPADSSGPSETIARHERLFGPLRSAVA